ncbi:MAG: hypothetical protein J7484_01020 [Microbacterium sp.]|nr:hypothetical protein [Microbacterium sp.]
MTWWRRRRLAIGGLVLAALAAFGAHFWYDVRPRIGADKPYVTADESGAVEAGGNRLSIWSVTRAEFEAPTGSTTLSVRMHAASTEDSERCGAVTLTEADGGRVWLDARRDVDIRSDEEHSCQEGSASYDILAVFLLPDDARGPFWLDVPIGRSDQVRLLVEE